MEKKMENEMETGVIISTTTIISTITISKCRRGGQRYLEAFFLKPCQEP